MIVEQERPATALFEQNYKEFIAPETAARMKRDALQLAQVAIEFATIERVPRYTPERRENDAEHSFMLGLIAQEIAASYYPELNSGLVAQFCNVHDLIELLTEDTPTFAVDDSTLQTKTEREHAKLDALCARLPRHTALLVRAYEEQELPEARFARLIDKKMPVLVDILGPGTQVMHEDYAVVTQQQLESTERTLSTRYKSMFPEPQFSAIHMARDALVQLFIEQFEPLPELQDALF